MKEASVLIPIICILIRMGFLLISNKQKVEGVAIITKVKRKQKDKEKIRISLLF